MPIRRAIPRLGCMGTLLFALLLVAAVTAVISPWAYHIGGRWTLAYWTGVGRLRDSNGSQYGLYVYFLPYARGGASRLPGQPWPRYSVRGDAKVCTANGAVYPMRLTGTLYGAYLDTNGSQLNFDLSEPRGPALRRHFGLYGTWQGPSLVMDDHKTMFMYFRPDGTLTPSGRYTSPVPEKHATVTLSWGSTGDFQSLCSKL
jgi:hypothetical protein